MGKRNSVLMMGVVVLLTAAMPANPARGASGGTPCNFEFEVFASPGLSTSPTSGTVSTQGEKGTMTCDGPVNGQRPTGPGSAGFEGRYGSQKAFSCHDNGQGEGVLSVTLPRAGGSEHVTSNSTYTHGAYQDGRLFSGTVRGERFSGTFEARPTEGDCVSTPITRFRVTGQGTLS